MWPVVSGLCILTKKKEFNDDLWQQLRSISSVDANILLKFFFPTTCHTYDHTIYQKNATECYFILDKDQYWANVSFVHTWIVVVSSVFGNPVLPHLKPSVN